MPIYEYLCEACGPFTELRPMAECEAPSDCPACGDSAPRVMLTAPRLAGMPTERLIAHGVNERSAHEPMVSGSERAHRHSATCGCGSKTKTKPVPAAAPVAKSFPSKRPWMISH
jgi:putative FmdB family regulatory protein